MRDFKTVFFRILFLVLIVVLVWQCNVHKKNKSDGVSKATSQTTTTTIIIRSSNDMSSDLSADYDRSADLQ